MNLQTKAEANATRPRTGAVEREAGERQGWGKEFLAFLRFHRKWWLIPIVVILLFVALLLMAGGTPLSPFIYPVF